MDWIKQVENKCTVERCTYSLPLLGNSVNKYDYGSRPWRERHIVMLVSWNDLAKGSGIPVDFSEKQKIRMQGSQLSQIKTNRIPVYGIWMVQREYEQWMYSQVAHLRQKMLRTKIMNHILYANRYNSERRQKCWNVHLTSHFKKMKHNESGN
jgi:hypothetical protein